MSSAGLIILFSCVQRFFHRACAATDCRPCPAARHDEAQAADPQGTVCGRDHRGQHSATMSSLLWHCLICDALCRARPPWRGGHSEPPPRGARPRPRGDPGTEGQRARLAGERVPCRQRFALLGTCGPAADEQVPDERYGPTRSAGTVPLRTARYVLNLVPISAARCARAAGRY
eukprot:SAG31_NODE_654_length_13128_cov_10.472408_3_plen_174_part_00